MIIKTRLFELAAGDYGNLADLARAMDISVSQIYRVRASQRNINQKFIVGALKALPQYKFEALFYLVPKQPSGIFAREEVLTRHRYMVRQFTKPDSAPDEGRATFGTSDK